MEDTNISPPGMPITRESTEGRGMFGRLDLMAEANKKFEEASAEGQRKDGEAIHSATQKGVEKVVKVVEWMGGRVEDVTKFGDKLYRGAEATVKRVANDSWQAVVGFAEDTRDVVVNTGKVALGASIAAVAIPTAAVVVGAEHLTVGLVELGQRGAKGLSELRAKVNGVFLNGVRAAAAAIEARALAGSESEKNRIDTIRDQHKDRLATIQNAYLGPKVAEIGKQAMKDYFKG